MRIACLLVTCFLACHTNLLQGQYFPVRIAGENQAVPDGPQAIVSIGSSSSVGFLVQPTGELAFWFVDNGPLESASGFWLDGGVFRIGDTLLGGSSPVTRMYGLATHSQWNTAGDLLWSGTDQTGDLLAMNRVALLFAGELAAGIPDRAYRSFTTPNLTANGDAYFTALLTGSSSDREVIYSLPAGGTLVPLTTGPGGGLFRSQSPIQGGALAGQSWSTNDAFRDLESSEAGVLLIHALTTPSGEVLIRKQPGVEYEVLLTEGDLLPGAIGPIDHFLATSQARASTNWAAVATVASLAEVVIADVGNGPQVILQDNDDVSAAFGRPTTITRILNVSINSSGTIVLYGFAQQSPGDAERFIMQWSNGALELILDGETAIVGSPLRVSIGLSLTVNDQGRIFFQGSDGSTSQGTYFVQTFFEAVSPVVEPIDSLSCELTPAGDAVIATWPAPMGQNYTGIRVFVNDLLEASLGGTESSYTLPPVSKSGPLKIEVEPYIGADVAPRDRCSMVIQLPPDRVECLTPVPATPIGEVVSPLLATLQVPPGPPVRDVAVSVEISHGRPRELIIDLTSPNGTQVALSHSNVGYRDDLDVTFADFGGIIPKSLHDGGISRPEGPGSMADLKCEDPGGEWVLSVFDDDAGTTGTLHMWCLQLYEESAPTVNCCALPTHLTAANLGSCGGPAVALSWVLPDSYDGLSLRRVGNLNTTTFPISSNDTAFVDQTVLDGATYAYTLLYRCQPSGELQEASSVTIEVDTATPPVTDLTLSPDSCSNEVTVSWSDNGIAYGSLTLQRDGTTLADVTGLTGFVDLTPPAGLIEYTLTAECGGLDSTTSATTSNTLIGVSQIVCSSDRVLCDGLVNLSWVNEADYSTLDILVDGTFDQTVAPTETSVQIGPLTAGPHVIEIMVSCMSRSVSTSCSLVVAVPPVDETDCVLALESVRHEGNFGEVNSSRALALALESAGFAVYSIAPTDPLGDIVTGLPCGLDLAQFERVWVVAGTFPWDYRLTTQEGDLLANLGAQGVGLYLESGDHWGFQHVVSLLDTRDGIVTDSDGDDTFTQMDGQAAPLAGLDLTAQSNVDYQQDNPIGNDYLDRFGLKTNSPGTAPDAMVAWAQPTWRNSPDGLPFDDDDDNVASIMGAVARHLDGGVMISQSWEFGGYRGDQSALAAAYVSALELDSVSNPFKRADCNTDSLVDIGDSIRVLGSLFPQGPVEPLDCEDACDVNDDGTIDIADAVSILAFLFPQGTPIDLPAPVECGEDPTDLEPLSCTLYPSCP